MTTISDVARRAGVSTMTVSRVINSSGYVRQATRERVELAVAQLGYVPNALARQLRIKQTKTLALILTDITNPFFTTVARGVEDVARELGFSVVFCNTDESEREEIAYLRVLLQKQVDGVLLVPAQAASESIVLLTAQAVPVVVLDRRVEGGPVDGVRCDSEAGAFTLVQHLLGLGHQRIAVLSGPRNVSTAVDRVAGYRRALRQAGLSADEARIHYGGYTQAEGFRMAQNVLMNRQGTSAIFAANNFIAFGAIRAIRQAGLRIPQDMSIVSFDDLPSALVLDPFLTVVAQPAYEIGHIATELLVKRLAGESLDGAQEIVMPTELIIRRSSARPGHEA